VSKKLLYRVIQPGTMFQLQQGDISLLCSVEKTAPLSHVGRNYRSKFQLVRTNTQFGDIDLRRVHTFLWWKWWLLSLFRPFSEACQRKTQLRVFLCCKWLRTNEQWSGNYPAQEIPVDFMKQLLCQLQSAIQVFPLKYVFAHWLPEHCRFLQQSNKDSTNPYNFCN